MRHEPPHLPAGRRYKVVDKPENDRIAADLARGINVAAPPFTDMVATVRHESDYAEKTLQDVINELTRGRKHVPLGLHTVLVAIRACRKAVE